jgi:hypothetical protein
MSHADRTRRYLWKHINGAARCNAGPVATGSVSNEAGRGREAIRLLPTCSTPIAGRTPNRPGGDPRWR